MPLRTSIQLINTTPPGSSVATLELVISAWENHESQDWTLFSWYADLILEGSGARIDEIIPASTYANDYFNADLSSDKTVISGFGFTGSPFASKDHDLFRIGSVLIQLDQIPSADQPLKITLQAVGNSRNEEGTISLQTVAASKQLFPGVSPSPTGDLAKEIGTIIATIDDSLDQPLLLQGSSNTAPNLNSDKLILSGTEDQPLLFSVDKLLQQLGFSDADNNPPALKFVSGTVPNLELFRNNNWINLEEEMILDVPEEQIRWLPPANQTGDVALFSVSGWDGKSSSPEQAVISVKLEPIDDPSTITGDTSASTEEDNSISGDLDATDTEGLTNNTPFSIADDPSNGSASIDAATGAWTYTPNADFNGSDSFIISITDDLGGTTKQAINISIGIVNDPSTISGNTAANTKEDNTVSGDLDATDIEGLTNNTPFSIANDPSNGSASIDAATGSWTYTPNADFNGSDSFIVSITDDLGGTTTQAITINVEPVDDPSSIIGDTTANTKEDNSVSGDLDATDTEGLTNNTPFSIANDPSNGSASIDAATGSWTYTPNADFNGSDSFIVSITDDLGGTTKQAINISITQVNDVPSGELNFTGSTALNDTLNLNSTITDVDGVDPELIRYGLDRKAAWSNTWESLSDPWSPTVHVLKPIDLGMRLRISASYTDGGGTAERVNSAPLLIPYPEPSLHGSSADEQLIGSDRDDTITAAAGADSLLAFGGDDHLDGGSGWDTLYLRGPRADYALHKLQEDLLRLSDSIHQRDGTDLITGIEQLQFADELLPISAVIDELPLATTDAWKADLDGDQLFSPISDGIAIASHFLPASGANLSSRAELALGINSGYLDFNQDKLLQRNEAELLLRFGFGTFPGSHLSEGLEIATSPDQLALQLAALL